MLHTVNKSPFQNNALTDCSRYVQAGDVVLLLEDGVFAAQAGTTQSALLEKMMEQVTIYALSADLKARAIKALVAGVQVTDYAGFVELVEQHKIHSWL
ncbi:MAG: sulfurtransferase complex subunit TusB [Magnetococcales bacterium]|nr:sulfurtransferase complex subunit TusB [Magnetococcales bacterium]MBF0113938.1 sulfurtransferase complex subunit TusB [Magnetococcales bacterium]